MLTCLRYALATVCFALSVGCLALWWRSFSCRVLLIAPNYAAPRSYVVVETWVGFAMVFIQEGSQSEWMYGENKLSATQIKSAKIAMRRHKQFWRNDFAYKFPLWYPALVGALAGVGALRLGRRFTLRSAIIATTVVAGLLGIVVAL